MCVCEEAVEARLESIANLLTGELMDNSVLVVRIVDCFTN